MPILPRPYGDTSFTLNSKLRSIDLDLEFNVCHANTQALTERIDNTAAGVLPGVNEEASRNTFVYISAANAPTYKRNILEVDLGEGSVSSRVLQNGSVTNDKIALNISGLKLQDGSIPWAKISPAEPRYSGRPVVVGSNGYLWAAKIDPQASINTGPENHWKVIATRQLAADGSYVAQWSSLSDIIQNGSLPLSGLAASTLQGRSYLAYENGAPGWKALLCAAENYADGSVGSAALADTAVTSGKIADGAVISSKLGPASVTFAKIAANSVGGGALLDSSVTYSKLSGVGVRSPTLCARRNADGSVSVLFSSPAGLFSHNPNYNYPKGLYQFTTQATGYFHVAVPQDWFPVFNNNGNVPSTSLMWETIDNISFWTYRVSAGIPYPLLVRFYGNI